MGGAFLIARNDRGTVFHTVETFFPLRGKIAEKFSIAWKIRRPRPPGVAAPLRRGRVPIGLPRADLLSAGRESRNRREIQGMESPLNRPSVAG